MKAVRSLRNASATNTTAYCRDFERNAMTAQRFSVFACLSERSRYVAGSDITRRYGLLRESLNVLFKSKK